MADEKNPMAVIGPALMTAGCMTVAAAGAIASDGGDAGGTVTKADDGGRETAGRYDDLSPDYS